MLGPYWSTKPTCKLITISVSQVETGSLSSSINLIHWIMPVSEWDKKTGLEVIYDVRVLLEKLHLWFHSLFFCFHFDSSSQVWEASAPPWSKYQCDPYPVCISYQGFTCVGFYWCNTRECLWTSQTIPQVGRYILSNIWVARDWLMPS